MALPKCILVIYLSLVQIHSFLMYFNLGVIVRMDKVTTVGYRNREYMIQWDVLLPIQLLSLWPSILISTENSEIETVTSCMLLRLLPSKYHPLKPSLVNIFLVGAARNLITAFLLFSVKNCFFQPVAVKKAELRRMANAGFVSWIGGTHRICSFDSWNWNCCLREES